MIWSPAVESEFYPEFGCFGVSNSNGTLILCASPVSILHADGREWAWISVNDVPIRPSSDWAVERLTSSWSADRVNHNVLHIKHYAINWDRSRWKSCLRSCKMFPMQINFDHSNRSASIPNLIKCWHNNWRGTGSLKRKMGQQQLKSTNFSGFIDVHSSFQGGIGSFFSSHVGCIQKIISTAWHRLKLRHVLWSCAALEAGRGPDIAFDLEVSKVMGVPPVIIWNPFKIIWIYLNNIVISRGFSMN